ncbi:MAG TPA: hypothetical protein VK550_31115 [Polyangiaceae bacterium]|nr:hypothetical protein [Polyangiaceae bacterium]
MAHPSSLLLLAAMLLGCSGAQQHHAGEPDRAQAHADASVAGCSAAIAAAMRGSHRSPGAADRDPYRHPVETLAFLGFTPTMTVLDVGPGGRGLGAGYYTELLAPVLAKDGLYLATNREPPSTAPAPSTHHWTLPPELALGDVDRDKYLTIGESDRMTLKFVRVADGAAR